MTSPCRAWRLFCLTVPALVLLSQLAPTQDEPSSDDVLVPAELRVTPASLTLEVGDTAQLEAEVFDESGQRIEVDVLFFSRGRRSVSVDHDGNVTAIKPGSFTIVARTANNKVGRASARIAVTIAFPPLESIEFEEQPQRLYVDTTIACRTHVTDASGAQRAEVTVELASSDREVAQVDSFGHLRTLAPGFLTLTARAEDVLAKLEIEVIANPVRSLEFVESPLSVRTGDVVHFSVVARDESGETVQDVPLYYSFSAQPDDDLGPAATGQIKADGRFVAEKPGLYTVVVNCGSASARHSLRAEPRDVQRRIRMVGQGRVNDAHTSDLWVWEGVDGRDYAVTGTWGANGEAHFWDVTDPKKMERIATLTVDARTVNDVKVSADGRICVLSREGASNRRNGLVIVSVTDPRNPEILSTFDDELTGGVHNVFIYEDHVYALSAARRYDIINIADPKKPHRVGTFELEDPRHSIHDVWVEDGLAYSSNWSNGVVIVDVGNGIAGGSPENPELVGRYTYPSGWNHAAFPHRDEETGKFYVIAGDEAFPHGLNVKDKPTYPRGWVHFIDFTDMENPEEVARYQVPEAGTHNLWVEGDLLYVAYYNGGLRVIDISGELMGDLYNQGREVGWFLPDDPDGHIPNAPMAWGPQPHKGRIFFSDWNSGLWAVELSPEGVTQ